jgi:photosystem II oxygen-evolving enhancer protein 3
MVIVDGTSYSEGAAYGSDQSAKVYSPYSVYSDVGADSSATKAGTVEGAARKKAIVAETEKRLELLPAYIEKKQWFNVKDELTRYMYETRGAVRGLAKTTDQKEAATAFFQAIEKVNINATLKKQDPCMAAAKDSVDKLDAFVKTL